MRVAVAASWSAWRCSPARPARDAHPAPFSFLDLLIDERGVRGSLIVHDLDAAHDLGVEPADRLLDRGVAESYRARCRTCSASGFASTQTARPV